MKNKNKEEVYSVILEFDDSDSSSYMEMKSECLADVMMAARGWLMCSYADKVTVYNQEGFDVAAYIRQ